MKYFKALYRVILTFIFIYLIIALLFAFIYFIISTKENIDVSFIKWYYFSLSNFGLNNTVNITINDSLLPIITIQHIVYTIVSPIFSGFIFYYILNRDPNIVFPKNILLRKRTSENSDGLLTLGLIIGNKNKYKIYDVHCKLVYIYHKKRFDGIITTNSETILDEYTPYINNYYRFSYSLEDFPTSLIKSIIYPNELNQKNSLIFIIQGIFGSYGDNFLIEKSFSVSDIIIAKETKLIMEKKHKSNGSYKLKPNWNNMNTIIDLSDIERESIISEMDNIINATQQSV